MSKIPQGEWSAIAARYAQGESISRIAQSYGCTPPAIHYILKRNRQRAAPNPERLQNPEQQLNGRPDALPAPTGEAGQPTTIAGQAVELRSGLNREIAPVRQIHGDRSQPTIPQQPAGASRNPGRASAFTAGLDNELHGRAEAAIEAFRSSFDAALAEGSPGVRQKLRQAASDLMRVAARTTIVLDRLNASAERASIDAADCSRSGHARWPA
jgi:transposase-like protein